MTIRNHLVERKWLKQLERKGLKEGIKVTHQVKSITWINQSSYFKWVSRMVLGGKPSVVFGRLTWKWWSKGHLRCLVEAIKRVDQEKQATPKRRSNSWISKWYSHASIDQRMKQVNHIMIVHLIILLVHISYGWRMDFNIDDWSSPSYKLDFTLLLQSLIGN